MIEWGTRPMSHVKLIVKRLMKTTDKNITDEIVIIYHNIVDCSVHID